MYVKVHSPRNAKLQTMLRRAIDTPLRLTVFFSLHPRTTSGLRLPRQNFWCDSMRSCSASVFPIRRAAAPRRPHPRRRQPILSANLSVADERCCFGSPLRSALRGTIAEDRRPTFSGDDIAGGERHARVCRPCRETDRPSRRVSDDWPGNRVVLSAFRVRDRVHASGIEEEEGRRRGVKTCREMRSL